ncbi:MAG TPA: glycosyltransferase [Anaerolineales bacterium]|nr:glycosyltransferase [Anaerolineales bacterium]
MARILYFTRDFTTHDHRFLAALAETEHQVYYLQLERRGHTLEDRPLPDGITRVEWAGGNQPFTWDQIKPLTIDLQRVIAEVRPDLIQAGPVQTAAYLVALTGFTPLVTVSWGSDLLVDARRSARYRRVTRYTLAHSAALVGDCQPVHAAAVGEGMPPDKIITFPWGVDLVHFSPTGPALEPALFAGQSGPKFVILSTRAWEPIYGVDILAQGFVLAAREIPELRLVMLGYGSLAGKLHSIFASAQMLERVIFPGQISQADLPKYYRSADLYSSASHSDGSSISLLEAMACGRPVLVSDIPGNRAWVTPGVQGWWFADGNPRSLAEGLGLAFAYRQDLHEIGQAARRLAEARANWPDNFKKLQLAYDLALSNSAIASKN